MPPDPKQPRRFRKKPVMVEAVQWTGANSGDVQSFMGYHDYRWSSIRDDADLIVHTPEGNRLASRGDWIVRGIAGEFYPCKPDIFEATYEPAD